MISNQILPTRKEIINLAGKLLPEPRTQEYFDLVEEADNLLESAYSTDSDSKSVAHARNAFGLNSLLSDALLHIANRGKLLMQERIMYLKEALQISVALLPAEYFSSKDFPFWLDMDTRPFMRALHCLGQMYHEMEMLEFSEFYLSFALDLNPNDNQGIRYELVNILLHQNKTTAAEVILNKYGESSAQFSYSRLLLGLLESNAPEKLNHLWDDAYEANQFVPRLLTNRTIPTSDGAYRLGDESEARAYVSYAWKTWDSHSETKKWLRWKYGITARDKLKVVG